MQTTTNMNAEKASTTEMKRPELLTDEATYYAIQQRYTNTTAGVSTNNENQARKEHKQETWKTRTTSK